MRMSAPQSAAAKKAPAKKAAKKAVKSTKTAAGPNPRTKKSNG